MTYPTIISPTVPYPLSDAPTLTSTLPSTYSAGQTFTVTSTAGWQEVDASGAFTSLPAGKSGPFLVAIGSEDILCSAQNIEGVVTVWSYGASNGRGYNSTTATAQAQGESVYLLETSAQDSAATQTYVQSATTTLTNKRITRRTLAYTANAAAPAIDTDNYDFVDMTGQTTIITSMTTNLTGTPNQGDELQIAITGSATAVTWGASFESSTVALPTVTVTTNRLDCFFVWNPVTSAWRLVATA